MPGITRKKGTTETLEPSIRRRLRDQEKTREKGIAITLKELKSNTFLNSECTVCLNCVLKALT